jgi:hypothetical protein
MNRSLFFCAWVFLFFPSLHVHAEQLADGNYAFNRVWVVPFPDLPQEFVANGDRIEVHFRSYTERADIDAFPEPPVTIVNRITNEQCIINDGGIWVRAEVYLSNDERVLLVNEFSGSGSDLISYDTSTCQQIKQMDVSDMHWSIDGADAYVGETCTGDNMSSCTLIRPLNLQIFFKP